MKKALVFFTPLILLAVFAFRPSKSEQLNFLFIIADDLRPELGTYGAKHIQSPNIDKLAASGAVFERAYCNIPVCGASRASFLSGIRPARHRFYSAYDYLNEQYPGAISMPRLFKQNGYTTISNGKVFHHKKDEADAWDEIWEASSSNQHDYYSKDNQTLASVEGQRGRPFEDMAPSDLDYKDGKIAQKAIEDLRKLKKSGKPFFLTLGFHKPHLPFNAPKKYWDLYDINNIHLPANYVQPESTPKQAFHNSGELRNYYDVPKQGDVSEEMAKKLIHGYYASVSYVDAQIGKVLEELGASGMDKNTVVLLIGDHGWNLGDHRMWNKHCNFSSSLTTPLIVRVPDQAAGLRVKEIVEFVDIFPTFCELAGFTPPQTLQGESLSPLLAQKTRQKNYAIARWNTGWTLVKDQLFYTEWVDQKDKVLQKMLFDHQTDPLELNNLANQPGYQEKIVELSGILRQNRGADFDLDRRAEKVETNHTRPVNSNK